MNGVRILALARMFTSGILYLCSSRPPLGHFEGGFGGGYGSAMGLEEHLVAASGPWYYEYM